MSKNFLKNVLKKNFLNVSKRLEIRFEEKGLKKRLEIS